MRLQPSLDKPNPAPEQTRYQSDEPIKKRQCQGLAWDHSGEAERLNKDDLSNTPTGKRNRHHSNQQGRGHEYERI